MKKISTIEMEIILSNLFDFRRNLIVPNVSWGMYLDRQPLHECDLLVCTGSNYLYEIEIKISKADLLADKRKGHGHNHPSIKRLYFAYPGYLKDCEKHIPERAGIITVERTDAGGIRTGVLRKPKNNMSSRPITEAQKIKLAHLAAMRIWGLKKKLI